MKKERFNMKVNSEVKKMAQKMAEEDRRRGITSLIEFLIVKEHTERQQKKKNNK